MYGRTQTAAKITGEAMRRRAHIQIINMLAAIAFCLGAVGLNVYGQETVSQKQEGDRANSSKTPRGVRVVTIPITVRKKGNKAQRELTPVDFTVREDGEAQRILSIRSIENTPLSVAVLIQDDLVAPVGNEIRGLAEFIRRLPRGSRVFVGYIRTGSLDVRQKFTTDLERAAGSLRVPIGFASAAPYNPYVEIIEGLKRFEALPAGRRAMLVVSDGLDISHGADIGSLTDSPDMEKAIKTAQRYGVAVYSFYSPSQALASGNSLLVSGAQGALQRLSDETGGRAFFQGNTAPVSFDPFLRNLNVDLVGQLALSYLSTHPKKGYHRIDIVSGTPDVEIDHPAGYTR
jgi:VWFA-related protein